MGQKELAKLLNDKKIQRVDADPDTARAEIAVAGKHIVSAELIAEDDPALAFTALYDSIRKSIAAHMRANGYRTTKGPGGHMKTGEYAVAALDHLGIDDHLDEFDNLRTLRNQSEYDALSVDPSEVFEAAAHAQAILDAIAGDIPD